MRYEHLFEKKILSLESIRIKSSPIRWKIDRPLSYHTHNTINARSSPLISLPTTGYIIHVLAALTILDRAQCTELMPSRIHRDGASIISWSIPIIKKIVPHLTKISVWYFHPTKIQIVGATWSDYLFLFDICFRSRDES